MTEARSLHSAMLLPWLQQQNGITKQERVTHVIQRATAVLGVRSYKRTVRVDAIRVVTNHFEDVSAVARGGSSCVYTQVRRH